MIKSFFKWVGLSALTAYYVISGLLRVPFGTAGGYYRKISGKYGKQALAIAGGKAAWEGLDNLNPKECYLFVGNHQSYADIFLLFAALYSRGMRTLFMLKKELFKMPLFGLMAKYMGLIPIEREESRKALKTVLNAIKTMAEGNSLTIFPEGSRTKDGKFLPFKRGAFVIAERTKMPIVPFAIVGAADIMPSNNMSIRAGSCHISFLPPIAPGDMPSRELAFKVESAIREEHELIALFLKTEQNGNKKL